MLHVSCEPGMWRLFGRGWRFSLIEVTWPWPHGTGKGFRLMPSRGPALPDTTVKTPIAVEGWLRNAVKGERLEYWRGHLFTDRTERGGLEGREWRMLGNLAQFMLELEEDGSVVLCQRRHGPMDYSYYAVKA